MRLREDESQFWLKGFHRSFSQSWEKKKRKKTGQYRGVRDRLGDRQMGLRYCLGWGKVEQSKTCSVKEIKKIRDKLERLWSRQTQALKVGDQSTVMVEDKGDLPYTRVVQGQLRNPKRRGWRGLPALSSSERKKRASKYQLGGRERKRFLNPEEGRGRKGGYAGKTGRDIL